MNTDYRFILEKYRSGGSNRYTCPNCGKRKCFTRYIDTRTGRYLADFCGRCNHLNHCGYDYSWKRLFDEHPEMQPEDMKRSTLINGQKAILSTHHEPQKATTAVLSPSTSTIAPQTVFYDPAWVLDCASRESTFSRWVRTLPFPQEDIQRVLREYYVGATRFDIVKHGINYGPAVIFWLIDHMNHVHDGKMMAYRCDGHRMHEWCDSVRSVCIKRHVGPQLERTDKVLFGLHLIIRHTDKPIALVESEKTCIIGSLAMPQYLWLATSGCGGLNAEKLKPLKNRHIIVIPDSGCYDKWTEQMRHSRHPNYRILRLMEQYPPNTDIADLILRDCLVANNQPLF